MKGDIWDPFDEMKRFRKDMDKMFDNFWGVQRNLMKKHEAELRAPAMDIEDKKDSYEVSIELPGIDKKDITVTVEENRVEVKAEKKEEEESKKKDYYHHERSYTGFYRAFSLPGTVNPDNAKSSFKEGLLTITLPKVEQIKSKKKVISLK